MSVSHWESYYRAGGLATCPTGPDGSYDQEVRQAWEAFFEPLPDGAALLDVGTGNGAIPLIARELATRLGRRWDIHGTDLARIDPARDVQDGGRRFAGIVFHGGVATETLPFADASFDAVSGQYALEYMALEPALTELQRVLRPGGRMQFILHHVDSVLVANARESLGHAELVLRDTRVYQQLRRLLAAERESPAAAETAAAAMNGAAARLHAAMKQAGSPLILHVTLDALTQLWDLRRTLSATDLASEIEKVEGELQASVQRLEALAGHALSADDVTEMMQRLSALGFTGLQREPQVHAGTHLVGWRITCSKPRVVAGHG